MNTTSTRRATLRRRILLGAGTVTLAFPILALASPLDIPNEFTDGDVISADAFNENFEMVAASVDDNDARITALEQGGAVEFPSGGVVFFNTETCPEGWAELQTMRGRVPVGLPAGGTLAAAVGTGLGDEGTRTISQVPSHSHSANPPLTFTSEHPGHLHQVNPPSTDTTIDGSHTHVVDIGLGGGSQTHLHGSNAAGDAAIPDGSDPITSAGNHDHSVDIGTFNSGLGGTHVHQMDIAAFDTSSVGAASVDVTMPYVQLLACQKT